MVGAKRTGIKNIDDSDVRTISTSHVERNNGTIRTFMKRFCRLTYAFSKKFENHVAACAMFVAYYNFVWRTRHSDKSGKPGKLRPTAAMMAKVVPDLWSFDRLYNEGHSVQVIPPINRGIAMDSFWTGLVVGIAVTLPVFVAVWYFVIKPTAASPTKKP